MTIPPEVQAALDMRRDELRARGGPGLAGYGQSGSFTSREAREACMYPPYDSWHTLDGETWRLIAFGVLVGDTVWTWQQEDPESEPEVTPAPMGGRWQ